MIETVVFAIHLEEINYFSELKYFLFNLNCTLVAHNQILGITLRPLARKHNLLAKSYIFLLINLNCALISQCSCALQLKTFYFFLFDAEIQYLTIFKCDFFFFKFVMLG